MTPVVAVVDELAKRYDDSFEVFFVCDTSFEVQATQIMKAASVPVQISTIQAGKLRRYKHFRFVDYLTTPSLLFRNFVDIGRVGVGFVQSVALIRKVKPDVVFAKGGFVCLPVGWAAKLLRVPLVIHDSDARPGITNRLLASSAAQIATGYPLENYSYDHEKSHYTGVPVRRDFGYIGATRQAELKSKLGFGVSEPLVVAFGGGLGSMSINEALLQSVNVLLKHNARAVLLSGLSQFDEVSTRAQGMPITVHGFISEGFVELLGAADVVITRASATSMQELAAMGKPVIAVPARQLGDQHKNADVFAASGAAIVLTDDQLAEGVLSTELDLLLRDESRREELARTLHEFARPDAASQVAELIHQVVAARKR